MGSILTGSFLGTSRSGRYRLDEAPRALQHMKEKSETRIKLMIDIEPSGG